MSQTDTRQKLKQAIANIDALPAMPSIAQKLLTLQLDTDAGEQELLHLIGQDPQLAGKVVGLANSPAIGSTLKVTTVPDAALLLGLSRIKSIALGVAALSGLSKGPASKHFKPHDLWVHSMMCAIVMRTIAQEMPKAMRPTEDHIFLAGLLHDIGFMALHHLDAELSNELHHQLRMQPKRPIIELEMEILGLTHCYIGSQLARHWHLPSEITAVIGYHHPPYVEEMGQAHPLLRLLHLTERLLPDFGINEHGSDAVNETDWLNLGIAPERADEIGALANELALQIAQLGEIL
jgi:HD-like signal output (HDOD) protein